MVFCQSSVVKSFNNADRLQSLLPRNRRESSMDLKKLYGFENNHDKYM